MRGRPAGPWADPVRARVLAAVMLSTGLVALDNTVVATAAPSVVRDLGGFAQLPWVFSVYLLAQAAGTPLLGKLCDLLGRRPVMLAGIVVFAIGSLGAGLAWDMTSLIGARIAQGLGAAAIQAVGMTLIGDLFGVPERGRVQGYLSAVWGVASVLGPVAGGALADAAGWRWIFLINLPLCLAAGVVFLTGHRETRRRVREPVDYAGAGLLTAGCSLVVLALLTTGQSWPLLSPAGIGLPVGGLLALGLFVVVERRAADPVLPARLFTDRTTIGSNLGSVGLGATMLGVSSYVPLFAQDVLGADALSAGLALAPLMLGWPLAASCSALVYLRLGFRTTALAGGAVTVAGTIGLALLGPGVPLVAVGAACFVTGLGLGLVTAPLMLSVQATAGWEQRGAVTATVMFARSLGSAAGVAALGAVVNAATGPGTSAGALAGALHRVFLGLVAVAVLLTLAAAVMRRDRQPRPAAPLELEIPLVTIEKGMT